MAYHTTLVPCTSGQPDDRYTEAYLEDFLNTLVVPTSGAFIVQILENRGSHLIVVWDDSL